MAHPLDGCRAKLGRAQEHLDALNAETRAYFNRKPWGATGHFDAQTSEYVFRWRVYEEPPARLGVLVGDVLHNVSSALDHLAWKLVELDGGTPGKWTEFPIYESRSDYAAKLKRGMLDGMSAFHRERIEQFQPYLGDDTTDGIAALRRLSNADKHRALNAAIGVVGEDGIDVQTLVPLQHIAGQEFVCRVEWGPIEDGTKFLWVAVTPTGPEPKMDVDLHITTYIVFGEQPGLDTEIYAGHVIEPTLQRIVDFAANTLLPLFALDF